MNDAIYTITTIENPTERTNIKGGTYMSRGSRTVGYMFNFGDAHHLLTNNACDLNEAGFYPLAVIECFGEGIYPCTHEEYEATWYEWNKEQELYQQIECPEEYTNIIGFGMS